MAKLTELACFTDDYVATDMDKVRKFEDGLKLSIRGKIVGLLVQDMDSMVRIVVAIEREINDAKSIQDTGVSGKRKENQFSSGSGKMQRTFVPQGSLEQGCSYQGQGQVRATSQIGPMTCYYFHQPGHMKRDFPQRQGSQSYGTPQSQSSVGCAQTQYVSPYSNTGQGNRHESQGAAQPPTSSQTSQRGQSMGRGQGQGSQAGTSGTQGRIYTVTP